MQSWWLQEPFVQPSLTCGPPTLCELVDQQTPIGFAFESLWPHTLWPEYHLPQANMWQCVRSCSVSQNLHKMGLARSRSTTDIHCFPRQITHEAAWSASTPEEFLANFSKIWRDWPSNLKWRIVFHFFLVVGPKEGGKWGRKTGKVFTNDCHTTQLAISSK